MVDLDYDSENDLIAILRRRDNSYHGDEFAEVPEYYDFHEVSICLIDVVGFSKWCKHTCVRDVVRRMIKYNKHLTDLLREYNNLTKIELVGDSCLVVGGMCDERSIDRSTHVNEMVRFCLDLIDSEQTGFSFRIGVHVGDVFGTFIKTPTKFQLFGNDINTASRLQSSSLPGVVHVSSKVFDQLADDLSEKVDVGRLVPKTLKGIGELDCAYLTRKTSRVLMIGDLKICQSVILESIKHVCDVELCTDMSTGLERMKQTVYASVLISIHLHLDKSPQIFLKCIEEFRLWETQYRGAVCVQPMIALVSDSETLSARHRVLFTDEVRVNDAQLLVQSITYAKEKQVRGLSMDVVRPTPAHLVVTSSRSNEVTVPKKMSWIRRMLGFRIRRFRFR